MKRYNLNPTLRDQSQHARPLNQCLWVRRRRQILFSGSLCFNNVRVAEALGKLTR